VRRYIGRGCAHDISGHQATDEKNRLLPGAEATQQCDEYALAVEGVLVAVTFSGGWLRH
jgi:hypothetical protein